MRTERKSQRQLHNMKYRVVFGFLTSVALLCLAGGVFAKYYAGRSNKGVATASNLYFTSNYLKNVSEAESDYPVIYNNDAWDGNNAYSFHLLIRNYQNQLLYNDINLDITYKIEFQLVDTTDEGTYQVTYQNETKNVTSVSACEFDATLDGGQAMENPFKISIARPDGNTDLNYKSVGVQVTATPISPGYVANSEKLGGVFYASLLSAQYELTGGFSEVKFLDSFVGFPYRISYKAGTDNAAHTVQVTWNSEKLQLDRNSSYYASVQDGSSGKKYVEIVMEPYTTLELVFFRTSDFGSITTVSELEELVTIKDKTKTGEGGSE